MWTAALLEACTALANSPGWGTGPPELPCHPEAPKLTYRAEETMVTFHLCLNCLQGYIEMDGLLVGPESKRGVPQLTRACHRCKNEYPLGDFVSRSGAITVFCTDCRTAWGKQKKAAEEAAEQVAIAGAANGLRRIENELGEEFWE